MGASSAAAVQQLLQAQLGLTPAQGAAFLAQVRGGTAAKSPFLIEL